MATYFAECEKLYPGASRQQDDTYVNVVSSIKSTGKTWDEIIALPAYESSSNKFAIQLTQTEFFSLNGPGAIYHDDCANLPKWQQRVATTGATKEFGRFATLTDAGSSWSADVQVPDDRIIVRIYNGNPTAGGTHIAAENIDEELVTGFVTRHIRLFSAADAPLSGFNGEDQQEHIGGKLLTFDFGSSHSPPLSGGVSTFRVSTLLPGQIVFPSNHSYRVVGPGGEKFVIWTIFGHTLTVN